MGKPSFLRVLSTVLAVCLWAQGLKASPDAVRQVPITELTPEQMQRLITDPTVRTTRILIAQNETPIAVVKKEAEKKKEGPGNVHDDVDPGFLGNMNLGGSGGGNRETALIAFAVIGLVVVVAWVPYFPLLFYESVAGKKEVDRIHQLSLQQVLTGKSSSSSEGTESLRYGNLTSGRYSLFLRDRKDEESLHGLGLTAELGHYRFKGHSTRPEGNYWLLGPSVVLGAVRGGGFPLFAKLDLLAGTSFDSDLGLVSRGDLTLGSYLFGSSVSLNLGVGALYLRSKSGHGTLDNGKQLGLVFSGGIGYSF